MADERWVSKDGLMSAHAQQDERVQGKSHNEMITLFMSWADEDTVFVFSPEEFSSFFKFMERFKIAMNRGVLK